MLRSEWTHKFVAVRTAPSLDKAYAMKNMHIRVTAGLHLLGGNKAPYFSVTADIYRPGARDIEAGGCMHDEVLRFFPKLAPVVRLHLCDDNGSPMHDEANAWYDLAGYYGGNSERYHVGNSKRHFPLPPERIDPAKPWATTEYREPTNDECLAIFAEHVRVPVEEARVLADMWRDHTRDCLRTGAYPLVTMREQLKAWIEEQRPRWKREADEAIALLDQLIAEQAARKAEKGEE